MHYVTKSEIKNNKGFTLVETSIVILLLSLLLMPLFNFMSQQKMQEKQIEAEVINERVLAALAIYLKNNGGYPCPADPDLAYGDADFGVSMNCATPVTATVTGDVPVATLGIPYRLMMNPSGWKYSYTVTRSQTVTTPPLGTYDGSGVIDIVKADGSAYINNVPFVVVNPGKDGKGAYNLAGTLNAVSCTTGPAANAKDAENCDGDAVFRDMQAAALSNPTSSNFYDDLIFYDLAREESTLWVAVPNGAGSVDIVNRNTGNIGIGTGTTPPTEKLQVTGGNVLISTSAGGVGGSLTATQDIHSDQNVTVGNDVTATGSVTANVFYYQ